MRFPFILAIALATLPCVPVAAQEQAPQEQAPQAPTFRTGVDLISIDVSAVDSRGRPVDGLLAPEFSVKVDGQPRRVVSVQQVKYGYSPVPAGTRRPPPSASRARVHRAAVAAPASFGYAAAPREGRGRRRSPAVPRGHRTSGP